MNKKRTIRQEIDFQHIPELYYRDPKGFMRKFEASPDQFLCSIYTELYQKIKPRYFWQKNPHFTKDDFKVKKKKYPGGVWIMYVSLPPANDNCCIAYAMVAEIGATKFYAIEKNGSDATDICSLDTAENRIRFGQSGFNAEENMKALYEIHNRRKKSSVEVQRTFHSDGGYSEMIMDTSTNRAEIHNYDDEGNCIERVYGSFVHIPEMTDEELDAVLINSFSRYRMDPVNCTDLADNEEMED